jgi:hypothetical protein
MVQAKRFAVPSMRWLGMLCSDVATFNLAAEACQTLSAEREKTNQL